MTPQLVGYRFPFIPIEVLFGDKRERFEALLDTGFEGDVVVPMRFTADLGFPDELKTFLLADGSSVFADVFRGQVRLGPVGTFPVDLVALGNTCLVGLGLAHRFAVLLDHGERVVVEP